MSRRRRRQWTSCTTATPPEEIAQARANVDAAKANAHNAELTYQRLMTLKDSQGGSPSVTQSQIDSAKAAKDAADAQLEVAQQALILAKAGPRKEDIAQAEAQLKATEAQLALLRQQLKDADPDRAGRRHRPLAPARTRRNGLRREAGVLASPSSRRNGCAPTSPSRTCRRSRPAPRRTSRSTAIANSFSGHIGFISPVAEFTPQAIQTAELRTSLVYEVRVLVDDPERRAAPRHAGDRSPAAGNAGRASQP